jgi:hypothetical protein
LHSTKWSDKKKGWKPHFRKIIQYRIQGEMMKICTQFPDPNKTMINVTEMPSDAHEKNLKKEILEEISEKDMKKILDLVNQKVEDTLKNFQDTKNKEHEKTQKQINELKEDL